MIRYALLLLLASLPAHAADPDALWKIVHGKCVPNMQAIGNPAPCAKVDEKTGIAWLKDINGPAQYLLIPTEKVTGIEDPAILAPTAPNYFAAAWEARTAMQAKLPRPAPDTRISLAINSPHGRTQEQLHIHISCLRADIAESIAANQAAIGPTLAPLPTKLLGHAYRAMRLPDLTQNPFTLIADPAHMADHTIVIIDAESGFILLDDTYAPLTGDRASGEELQDHSCAGS